jgi:hypothetical protein
MSRSMRGFPGFSDPSDSGKGRSPPLQGQVRDGGRLSLSKGNRSEDFSALRPYASPFDVLTGRWATGGKHLRFDFPINSRILCNWRSARSST